MLRARTLLVPILVLCAGSGARPLDKIRKDALTVGMRTDNAPFGYQETADRKGLEYEMLSALAESLGLRFRVVKLVSQRDGEEKLQADKVDLVVGSVKSTEELRTKYQVTQPYFRTGLGILVLKSNQSVYTLSDLNGKPVAAIPESNADRLIDSFIPKAKLELVRTSGEGLSLLGKGDVEAFVHDRSVIQGEVSRNSALRLLDVSLTEDNYVMLLNRKSTGLMEALNSGLTRLRTVTPTDTQSPLAALCGRYGLTLTIKPVRGAAEEAPPPPIASSSTTPTPAAHTETSEQRIVALERRLQKLEARVQELETGNRR
jgi:polar amino acid transport system substrate-binding protein